MWMPYVWWTAWWRNHLNNFHPLKVVSRWRDSQLQGGENYLDLTKWRSIIFKSCWSMSSLIISMFKRWFLTCYYTIIGTGGWRFNPDNPVGSNDPFGPVVTRNSEELSWNPGPGGIFVNRSAPNCAKAWCVQCCLYHYKETLKSFNKSMR